MVRTLNNAPQEIRDRLRVLWRTGSYTPHALAVHPRVAAAEILHNLATAGWEPGQDKDWDDLRALPVDAEMAPLGR